MNDQDYFCNVAKDKTEHLIDSALSFSVLDSTPASKGHSLVVPLRHVSSLFELTDDEVPDVFNVLKQTKALLDERYHPDSYNIGINDGPAAGQTISHLHIHLIPRYKGDVPNPRGGIRRMFEGDKYSHRLK